MDSRFKHAVAVARTASFSRAAESVGVTQSAVTKSVADLERQVGYAIFHRTSKGAFPTEEGRDFLDRAARVLYDTNDILRNRRQGDDPYAGVLRIGVYPGSLEWLLTPTLGHMVRKHKGVRLDINTGTSERGLHLLTRGDIDVAFGMMAAFENWKELKCTPVGELSTHCFVRRGHPLLELAEITLDDVAEHEFVVSSMSAPFTDRARELYESRGIDPSDKTHVVDFFPLVCNIVSGTNAIGGIADSTHRSSSFQEKFVVLEKLVIFPPVSVGCAVRGQWPIKPAASALIVHLKSEWPKQNTKL